MWKDRAVLVVAGLLGVALLIGSIYVVLRPEQVHADAGRNGVGRGATGDATRYGRGNASAGVESAPNGVRQGRGQGNQGGGLGNQGDGTSLSWLTIEGTVITADMSTGFELVVRTTGGEEIAVGGGPSFFWTEQGYALEVGDSVKVTGYYEDGELKADQIQILTTGETLELRDASGRPLWAGRGRGQWR